MRSWSIRKAVVRYLARRGFVKIPLGTAAPFARSFTGWTNVGETRAQLAAYQGHVYKCVTLIYRRAQAVPMRLYKRQEERFEEVKSHPFLDLMRKPNAYMTGGDLKAFTFMHRDLTGKAFWLLLFNRLGRPVEIWPLPVGSFNRFVLNQDETGIAKYEFINEKGGLVSYDAEEIVYFKYPHPFDAFDGASPIQAVAYSYDTDLAIRVYQRNFFQNSARPDVYFESDQKIEPQDAKRILLGWKEAHQGVERSWEPAIMDQGLKLNTLTMSNLDLEFAALAAWTKEDILEAYNVPEGKLGSSKNVREGGDIGIDITFNSECITPRLRSYEEQITVSVLPRFDSGLFVKHANCIPRDREHDLKEREVNLKTCSTTVNEERAKMGLKPVPWGYLPWMPVGTTQAGSAVSAKRGNSHSYVNSKP